MFGFLCGQLDPNHKPNPTLVDEVLDTMVRRRPTGDQRGEREGGLLRSCLLSKAGSLTRHWLPRARATAVLPIPVLHIEVGAAVDRQPAHVATPAGCARLDGGAA